MRFSIIRSLIILCLLTAAWAHNAAAKEAVSVFVSILPQKYFVEKIGGDRVTVSVMVQPGASPATYEPKPRQMAALSEARIYCAIGVPFENAWLEKIAAANPTMAVVHTQAGIEKIPMATHHHEEGEAHHEDAHDSGIRDPHVWLSPPLVMLQARHIMAALVVADPAHRKTYEANYREFVCRIADLDIELSNFFANKGERAGFMVFHPSWGYFAKAYGLRQTPIEAEGKAPKPAALQHLIRQAREEGVRVIFAQPQFSRKSAQLIAGAIGGQVVMADPLAPDWEENLRGIAEKFKAALR